MIQDEVVGEFEGHALTVRFDDEDPLMRDKSVENMRILAEDRLGNRPPCAVGLHYPIEVWLQILEDRVFLLEYKASHQ